MNTKIAFIQLPQRLFMLGNGLFDNISYKLKPIFSILLTLGFGVPQGQHCSIYMLQLCREEHQKGIVYNMYMIQYYAAHAKQVNKLHVSTVLRKISSQFLDGQMMQILFLIVEKQKLWSYQLQHH